MNERDPDRIISDMSNAELLARQAGWYPACEAHVLFDWPGNTHVVRPLRAGETYNEETDSYMSRPLRHADSWEAALEMDARHDT